MIYYSCIGHLTMSCHINIEHKHKLDFSVTPTKQNIIPWSPKIHATIFYICYFLINYKDNHAEILENKCGIIGSN